MTLRRALLGLWIASLASALPGAPAAAEAGLGPGAGAAHHAHPGPAALPDAPPDALLPQARSAERLLPFGGPGAAPPALPLLAGARAWLGRGPAPAAPPPSRLARWQRAHASGTGLS